MRTQITPTHNRDHSSYGGLVYRSDFEGYRSMPDVASRIRRDQQFDRQCGKKTREREDSYGAYAYKAAD